MCLVICSAKSEAVKTEEKPVKTASDACTQQLPNHQRQMLEPKSITSSENKVKHYSSALLAVQCNKRCICYEKVGPFVNE